MKRWLGEAVNAIASVLAIGFVIALTVWVGGLYAHLLVDLAKLGWNAIGG